jgi:DNA-directed RNA polymerase subunit RPC12/RpoP
MAKCVQCGNDYDKTFEVTMGGRTMIFDSFECAIQALAPVCPHCGNRIIGHGVEHDGAIFSAPIAPRRKALEASSIAIEHADV